jgi:hypothetical protein
MGRAWTNQGKSGNGVTTTGAEQRRRLRDAPPRSRWVHPGQARHGSGVGDIKGTDQGDHPCTNFPSTFPAGQGAALAEGLRQALGHGWPHRLRPLGLDNLWQGSCKQLSSYLLAETIFVSKHGEPIYSKKLV